MAAELAALLVPRNMQASFSTVLLAVTFVHVIAMTCCTVSVPSSITVI